MGSSTTRAATPADAAAISSLLFEFNREALSPEDLGRRMEQDQGLETIFLGELDGVLAGAELTTDAAIDSVVVKWPNGNREGVVVDLALGKRPQPKEPKDGQPAPQPRGPRSILWVVIDTASATGTGSGCRPATASSRSTTMWKSAQT